MSSTCPNLDTITVLVAVYLVHPFPAQFNKFAGILAELRDSEEPTFAGHAVAGNGIDDTPSTSQRALQATPQATA